jgi:TrmH family RNA methyltransferase
VIPLYKLEELPRSQKLRKAASLLRNAEHRLIVSGQFPTGEAGYFASLTELLAKDEKIKAAALEELKKAQSVFASQSNREEIAYSLTGSGEIRRALNSVYHLLLSETGRNQADWDFIEASGALDSSKRRPFSGMQVYLEDIRSPFNVGSMFRTAESFGAEKIWLSPLSADPRHKRAERSAMGCVDILPWERFSSDPFSECGSSSGNPEEFSAGPFFALETGGVPIEDFAFPSRGILIAGSEELGVSPKALAASDASLGRVSISTRGAKGSLNVSVAFGIAMQAWAVRLA